MDTLSINTSQNIAIEQSIASVGERIAATLLDFLFMISYGVLLALVFSAFQQRSLMVIGGIPIFLYNLLSELFMNGQSWGKKIMKIKVITIDGTTTSFSSYFLRWIIGLIEILAFFGSLALITIILNRKGQRLGDLAANTSVIRLSNVKQKPSLFVDLPADYQLVYPEVARLSINDIYTIQEVLEIIKSLDSDLPRKTIAEQARAAVETKMNIKSELKHIPFFETLVRDYNFMNSRI
ncbi:MAG: RDD family protein [Prolixibacteraceae bacterium]